MFLFFVYIAQLSFHLFLFYFVIIFIFLICVLFFVVSYIFNLRYILYFNLFYFNYFFCIFIRFLFVFIYVLFIIRIYRYLYIFWAVKRKLCINRESNPVSTILSPASQPLASQPCSVSLNQPSTTDDSLVPIPTDYKPQNWS